MNLDALADYLKRPMTPPGQDVLEAIEAGPIDQGQALALEDVDRLLDPAPLERETGWCVLPGGVAYVAVRTAMPDVTGEMVDWWFDWHPRDPLRYRIWHPAAHRDNSVEEPGTGGREGVEVSLAGAPRSRAHARTKAHWGAVHHPVEDVGTGMVHARIEFKAPTEMGMSSDASDDSRVATIVCGYAGDDRLKVRHSPMFHVFLRDGRDGVILRSRFWLGAALRPYGPLGGLGERMLNRPAIRRRALPKGLPEALARHCAEEYANLGAILPGLWRTQALDDSSPPR